MNAHTPGPLSVWQSGFTGAPFVLYTGDVPPRLSPTGQLICEPGSYIGELSGDRMRLSGDGRQDAIDESSANAKLFAAAPDLLAALCLLIERIESPDGNTIRMARAAIKKAIGAA